jgi:hypothetical protein
MFKPFACWSIAALGLGSWLAEACGARTTLDAACAEECADGGGTGGSAGTAGAGGATPRDASVVCNESCEALAALNCPTGYDVAQCIDGCEAAKNGAHCGNQFAAAVECLLENGRAQCAKTGAPQFFDPNGMCLLVLDAYTRCAETRGP